MPSNPPIANLRTSDATLSDFASDTLEFNRFLTSVRRHLHRNPEVGMKEHETAQFIKETLEDHGLEVQGPIAGTGLYVDIEGHRPGGCVAYRADIDALPARDGKQVPYRSRNPGAAHLCGHDAHTAVGIGVALMLHHNRDQLAGSARVFFQPNEEGMPSGAPLMIKAGVLDGVNAVYCIHVDPTLGVGRYGLLDGAITAASDRFDVYVRHEGSGHSARPHEGTDTVWVATQIINAFYQLAGRITDARNATVLSVCRLFGSEAHNVIPDTVEFGGTLRTTSTEDRKLLRQKMAQIAKQTAATFGATANMEVEKGAPPVINEPVLIKNVEDVVREAYGPQAIYEIPQSSMGGEDFSYYLDHVPGALIRVGTASSPETSHPLHDHRFDIDETPLAPTAKLMARAMIRHLKRDISDDDMAQAAY